MATYDPDNRTGEVDLNESWGLSDTADAILVLLDDLDMATDENHV